MVKDFKQEFYKLLGLVKSREPFAFSRFSDGEVTILRGKHLELGRGFFIQHDIHGERKVRVSPDTYNEEEQKKFDPLTDKWLQDRLTEAFKHRQHNYFKGIPAQNALDGGKSWKFCKDLYGDGDDEHLSFSNVMINDNYKLFVKEMIPEFKGEKVIIVCNKNSKLDGLPFRIEAAALIGSNCMINDINLIEILKSRIAQDLYKDRIFLFAASTLSNLLCYELYKEFPQNQYIDIGSSLGPYMGLSG